jgi:hypothetical protein
MTKGYGTKIDTNVPNIPSIIRTQISVSDEEKTWLFLGYTTPLAPLTQNENDKFSEDCYYIYIIIIII